VSDKLLKPSNRWIVALTIVAALATLGLGIFVAAMLRPSETSVSENSVSEKSASDAVPSSSAAIPRSPNAINAVGRLEPAGGVFKVAAPSTSGTAKVARLLVKEGTPVKAGQVMALMDDSERLLASVMQAEAQVKAAQSYLARVQAGTEQNDIQIQTIEVNRLQEELKTARNDYGRYEDLYKNGAISASELELRRLTLESATQALETARRELDNATKMRPINIRQAQAQVEVAIANFNRAKADFNRSLVRAPINGRVIEIHANSGEPVGRDGILELGNVSQMYAIAKIDETDVSKVRVGQRATVTSSAFPVPISGVVEQIGLQVRQEDVDKNVDKNLTKSPTTNRDTHVKEVKVRLENSRTVADMTNLQVEVVIQPY
jgi:HlyD family secretion protein